jgi:hypothetical protein
MGVRAGGPRIGWEEEECSHGAGGAKDGVVGRGQGACGAAAGHSWGDRGKKPKGGSRVGGAETRPVMDWVARRRVSAADGH